ncbi:MAG: hypothetical protein QME25_04810 [Bacteroidota bacterium]|nr:hypothetical protein [Bacteroidota bacterium]
MRYALIILITLFLIGKLFAQGSAGSSSNLEPRYIIDMPTAGLISHASYAIDTDFYQLNGVLFGFTIGLLNRINLSVSYGGSNLIGSSKPDWNKYPGMGLKIRPFEESKIFPAIAIGFDTQGKENYIDTLNRFTIKSPGIYIVASKNFLAAGFLSIHGGVNYSLERADGDKDANLFLGVEKSIGSFISLIAEYNTAINDSDPKALGKGRGYLNMGFRGSLGDGFTIGVNLKDIIKNQDKVSIGNRTISIEYIGRF